MSDNIRPADLLIDTQNPRIRQPSTGQNEAIKGIAAAQGRKLIKLASDIQQFGLNPAELPIVMAADGNHGRYIVLEGNRRLTAVRVLENPELIADVVSKQVLSAVRKLSQQYQNDPIQSIACEVVTSRDDAAHWIELRHTGEQGGAGLVKWGSEESNRYKTRTGKPEIHLQALDYLESRGAITAAERAKVPATSLRRLLGTPEFRNRIGVEVQNGSLMLLADAKKVALALAHVVKDLASGKTKVANIYTKPQRVAYAKKVPLVKATRTSGRGVDVTTGVAQTKAPRAASVKLPKTRTELIPKDCALNVSDARCLEIEKELRRMKLADLSNAVSVLFRVFVELSTDAYIGTRHLPAITNSTLAKKMNQVADDLVARQKLTKQQAKAVRRSAQQDSMLAASTPLMNGYVHSQWIFPGPADLRAGWNNLQSYMIAIWAP